jgi:uncharacterized protein YlxP (DUF503 family)
MIVGLLILDIHLPYSHSLKEKRKRMLRFKNRLKNKHNVAFAELEFQDKWQRTRIGIVTLNSQKKIVDQMFQKIILEFQEQIDGEILSQDILFY